MRPSRPIAFSLFLAAVYAGCAGPTPPPERPTAPALPPAPPATAPQPTAEIAPTAAPAPPPPPVAEAPGKYAKCEAPPAGMACVPGGPAVIGSDDKKFREKPRHSVEISTFYIDKYEVTNKQYEDCYKAKACPFRAGVDPRFLEPNQPAVPVTFMAAQAYCLWAGKRLPTEAEWEKVARGGEEGRTYPWGEAPLTCDRAQIGGCAPGTTKPVGSFPPGPYGVYDMAGNGYEWVSDWSSTCYDGCPGACGAECQGLDPMGPCAGAPFCRGKKERVLKGGSFRWDAEEARGAWRRFEEPYTGAHRLSVRCASTRPVLSTWPPLAYTDPLPAVPDPEPPTEEQLATFRAVPEDKAVLELDRCSKPASGEPVCRSSEHFVVSNERHQELWEPFLKNLGGGYAGVGSDQGYNFIANARSRWAWLFDYDPLIVTIHALLREVILRSETPREFADAFKPGRFAETVKLAAPHIPEGERDTLLRMLTAVGAEMYAEYSRRVVRDPIHEKYDWLQNEDHYRYIRLLYRQGRILSVRGNLLTDIAMPAIAASARKLDVPIRVFYSSNADDHWELKQRYRDNLLGLPFDDKSIWIRTITPRRKDRDPKDVWQYVIHNGIDAQRKLKRPGWDWTWYFNADGHPSAPKDLIVIGMPGRTEREAPDQKP
jgi:formylglycine-generating enzyme required for sulfatase activity